MTYRGALDLERDVAAAFLDWERDAIAALPPNDPIAVRLRLRFVDVLEESRRLAYVLGVTATPGAPLAPFPDRADAWLTRARRLIEAPIHSGEESS